MAFYSPLRYPGGKVKVANYFQKIFENNSLHGGTYVEPYAGGASVALALLFNQCASKIIINDIDRSIYSFWYSVLNNTNELCKLIFDTPVTIDNWEIQRKIQKEKNNNDLLNVGFSTFFLNRTNRSGILTAGIIGGRQQNGAYKIDARYNKKNLIERIEKIAQCKNNIKVYNCDAIELIRSLRDELPFNTLFYFDPPYYVKGQGLYLNYYKNEDHQNVANEISQIQNQKWIITYDDVKPIQDIYSNYRNVHFKLFYSAGDLNKQGKEIMFFSDNINISDHPIIKLSK